MQHTSIKSGATNAGPSEHICFQINKGKKSSYREEQIIFGAFKRFQKTTDHAELEHGSFSQLLTPNYKSSLQLSLCQSQDPRASILHWRYHTFAFVNFTTLLLNYKLSITSQPLQKIAKSYLQKRSVSSQYSAIQ